MNQSHTTIDRSAGDYRRLEQRGRETERYVDAYAADRRGAGRDEPRFTASFGNGSGWCVSM